MIQLFLILLLSLTSSTCSAQYGSYTLNGTKWILTENGGHEHFIEFSSSSITHTKNFNLIHKTIKGSEQFYISPIIPTTFDQSRVGKHTTGKYLVEFSDKTQTFDVFEIIKLTEDSLILRLEDDPKKYMGGFDPIRKYKRVSDITNNTTGSSNGSITPVSSNWGNDIGSQTQQNSTSQTGTSTNSTGSRGRR